MVTVLRPLPAQPAPLSGEWYNEQRAKHRMQALRIAIIGVSRERSKYGDKAVRAYHECGATAYPINPNAEEVEGLKGVISDIGAVAQLMSSVSVHGRTSPGVRSNSTGWCEPLN